MKYVKFFNGISLLTHWLFKRFWGRKVDFVWNGYFLCSWPTSGKLVKGIDYWTFNGTGENYVDFPTKVTQNLANSKVEFSFVGRGYRYLFSYDFWLRNGTSIGLILIEHKHLDLFLYLSLQRRRWRTDLDIYWWDRLWYFYLHSHW